jgi:hypothetical protein
MAFLTKQQVKQILDNAPPNLDKGKVVESLIKQGHQLEGFDETQPSTLAPKQENILVRGAKAVARTVANPLLRLGATADALSTSKALAGKGINNETKKTPVGDVKPITTAKDAAGVGLELGATGLGVKGIGAAGKFASRFLQNALLGAGTSAGQSIQQEDSTANDVAKSSVAGAAVGGALPVAGQAVSLVKRFLGVVGKGAAASLSGVGSDAIEAVIDNPRVAQQAMRSDATQTLSSLASQVREKVSSFAREASDAYGEALEELPKRLGRNPKVLQAGQKTTIKVDGETFTLSMLGVKSKLTRSLREFDVLVDPRKKEFDFLQSPFRKSEENILKEVFEVIDQWRDTSPKGLNSLARKVGNYRKAGEQSPELNSIIDSIKSNVREYIGDRIPAARAMNQKYRQAKDFIAAIDQELATDGAFKGGTAEQIATAKKLATIFNKNKELARELVERLEGGDDILASEAGRELSAGVSRSTASIGDVTRGAIQTVIPPRLIGELVAATGIAKEALEPILISLKELEPASRTALLQLLTHALTSDDGQSTESAGDTEMLFPE